MAGGPVLQLRSTLGAALPGPSLQGAVLGNQGLACVIYRDDVHPLCTFFKGRKGSLCAACDEPTSLGMDLGASGAGADLRQRRGGIELSRLESESHTFHVGCGPQGSALQLRLPWLPVAFLDDIPACRGAMGPELGPLTGSQVECRSLLGCRVCPSSLLWGQRLSVHHSARSLAFIS